MQPDKTHIFICNHGNCAPPEDVGKIKFVLRKALGELTRENNVKINGIPPQSSSKWCRKCLKNLFNVEFGKN